MSILSAMSVLNIILHLHTDVVNNEIYNTKLKNRNK